VTVSDCLQQAMWLRKSVGTIPEASNSQQRRQQFATGEQQLSFVQSRRAESIAHQSSGVVYILQDGISSQQGSRYPLFLFKIARL
jgi:hypothetical protein